MDLARPCIPWCWAQRSLLCYMVLINYVSVKNKFSLIVKILPNDAFIKGTRTKVLFDFLFLNG